MILLAAIFPFLFSCGKDMPEENYLPGKWNLVQSELYENDSLRAVSQSHEVNTVYYFSAGETGNGSSGDMYVEEDGEQQFFEYVFDQPNKMLLVGQSSIFKVEQINSASLYLVRDYDQYRSTYLFHKSK